MKSGSVYDEIHERYHEDTKDNFYNGMETQAMVNLLKRIDVKDKKILDLGCGSGKYTRILVEMGGTLWGIDPSKKLLEIARKENATSTFMLDTGDNLPFESGFFDMVVAGLSVSHFRDIDKSFKEISRVLRRGGVFIFSRENPIIEITKKTNSNGYRFDGYFDEGEREREWPRFGVKMVHCHITFQTLIRAFLKNNFVMNDFIDVKPDKKLKERFPEEYESNMNRPYFCIFSLTNGRND